MPIARLKPQWGLGIQPPLAPPLPIGQPEPEWNLGVAPSTRVLPLGPMEAGNYQTVEVMRKIARARAGHPSVRGLALNVIRQANIPPHNFLDEAATLAGFVQSEVRYVRDIDGVEQLHDPLLMIRQLMAGTAQGDCDDMSLLLASLLLSVGAQPFFAIVRYRDTCGPFNHIYVVCYEKNWGPNPRQRLVMDTILPCGTHPIGTEVPHRSLQEIKV